MIPHIYMIKDYGQTNGSGALVGGGGTLSRLFTKRFLCYLMYPCLSQVWLMLNIEAFTVRQTGGITNSYWYM